MTVDAKGCAGFNFNVSILGKRCKEKKQTHQLLRISEKFYLTAKNMENKLCEVEVIDARNNLKIMVKNDPWSSPQIEV